MTRTRRRNRRPSRQPNLLSDLLLVFPLLLFYSLGVLFSDVMNGADFITQHLLHLLGLRGYLAVQGALVLAFVVALLILRRGQRFDVRTFVPVLLESGIYALTMGTLIIFIMDFIGIDPRLAAGTPDRPAGLLNSLVMAAGAGVHEELVFRLILLNALLAVGDRVLSLRPWLALVLAFALSALLFSAAHHVGPLGEPLRLGVFVYRAMAGLFFAALYRFRSFAIAVYTHTLYDIYVLVVL